MSGRSFNGGSTWDSIGVDVDLARPREVHVVGVGGAGMSAIATVLASMGHVVTGSDLKGSAGLERLRGQGVSVVVGHDAKNVADSVDYVAISTAVPATNPEVVAAVERGIPVLSRSQVLAAIASVRKTIAVAGTHGKTTTSSMLALVLVEAGFHPSFIIGGEVNEIGTGAAWDRGDLFVVEADESDGTFLDLPRQIAVVTNVEPDHLEFYGGVEAMNDAFGQFLADTPGPRIVCADNAEAAHLGRANGAVTYGTSEGADYQMVGLVLDGGGSRFELVHDERVIGEISVPVAGAHNARNACAAAVAGMLAGAPFEKCRAALGRFAGVARRFEHRGERAGVTFIDDYAHLPSEVSAALAAALDGRWGRVVCVFQPHRFSRTETLWRDFADSFIGADVLVVTDVYPSGEYPRPGVSGKLIVQSVLDAHPWQRVAYLPRRSDAVDYLVGELRPNDLCISLGAGDITLLADEVQERLTPVLESG